jgi:hypothetical protein
MGHVGVLKGIDAHTYVAYKHEDGYDGGSGVHDDSHADEQKQGHVEDDEADIGHCEGMLEVSSTGGNGPVRQKHGEVQDVQGSRQAVLEEKEGGRHCVGLDGPQKNDGQVLGKDVEKRIADETVDEGVDVKGEFFGEAKGHLTDLAANPAARANPEE